MTATQHYRLERAAPAVVRPELDASQQRVVDHPGGPLLVLAGPGTGKTTTLVEAIAERIEGRGARPDEVLALTFSRKAADELRDRVTARLGRTLSGGMVSTFHSFAYGLVRQYSPPDLYESPLTLLSAPEQDVVLRELLTDHPESVRWPESFHRALGTRGFAHEVNAVLSRAREKGYDGETLHRLGVEHDLPEFAAAGLFLEQYLIGLDNQGATDYADLIRRAALEAADHRDELRARFTHVFVDEYQDTDPGQVALLRQLAGDGRNLTVVGDPHQSIYAFRGAEVRGILEFPAAFPRADGGPADVVALGTTRRFGPNLLLAAQRVAGRLALPGAIPDAAKRAFLRPVSDAPVDGRVVVRTFDTERAEAEHLADLLRRAHLEDGIAWHDMAVLVRSGRSTIPPLRRALGAAGVPVEVASDELPLVRDPAVLPLLDALRAVVNLDNHDPEHVDHLHAGRVESLLLGPLGGLDAGRLRRLARQLRVRAREQALAGEEAPAPSRELVRRVLVEPGFLDGLSGPEADAARALVDLLTRARGALDAGAAADDVLWLLWSGTAWPERLRHAVSLGGGAARRAHRDLDAVCALFDLVARTQEKKAHRGVGELLARLVGQEIPAESLADRGARGSAVRLLTAHRSKGLEWRLVVVAHVQADGWPDLRRRASLLQPDRIGTGGQIGEPMTPAEMLLEERRLFYVACTRARERLVVTAVKSPDDDGEQPSRFLDELGVKAEHIVGRPVRPLSLAGLVADLRRTVTDPVTPEPLREAAARRLARLARETAGQRPLAAQADPATWWGTRSASLSSQPLRDPEQPVPISASLVEQVTVCPTHWFLEREAGGVARSHQAANLGQVLHAIADRVATGELDLSGLDDGAAVSSLMQHVDAVWDRLDFRTPWAKAREHTRVEAALGRFVAWHRGNQRTLLGTEQRFSALVEVSDPDAADAPPVPVRLTGYADRVELDAEGRVVIVDLKTGRTKPSDKSVATHLQLGLYQLAVDHGAVDELLPPEARPGRSGGGELVQLGMLDDQPAAAVQPQEPQPDGSPTRAALTGDIARAADLLRRESFPAVPGNHCRECPFVPVCPARSAGSVTGP